MQLAASNDFSTWLRTGLPLTGASHFCGERSLHRPPARTGAPFASMKTCSSMPFSVEGAAPPPEGKNPYCVGAVGDPPYPPRCSGRPAPPRATGAPSQLARRPSSPCPLPPLSGGDCPPLLPAERMLSLTKRWPFWVGVPPLVAAGRATAAAQGRRDGVVAIAMVPSLLSCFSLVWSAQGFR